MRAFLHPRLKGRLDLYLLGLRLRGSYVVGLVGLIYSAAMLFVDSPPGGVLGLAAAAMFFLLGGGVFGKDVLALRRDTRNLYEVELSADHLRGLRLTDTYVSSGYRSEDLGDLRAFYSPEVNRLLATTRAPLTLLDEEFQLSRGARALQPFLLRNAFRSGAVLFNEDKVRLAGDPTVTRLKAGEPLHVQKTDYFAGLCTNEMARREVRSRETGAHRFSGMETMANNGFLLDLEQSLCSNHVGVASLAFTCDGQLVATVQSRGSAQSPSLLASSASGSADWHDLHAGEDLHGFLVRAIERELLEECGLEAQQPQPRVETRVVGFARLLMRGGKPEFFGISYLDVPFAELSVTRKEAVYIADLMGARITRTGVEEAVQSIDEFVESHRHSLSLPLHLHLRFLKDYVRSFPAELGELLAGTRW